MIAHYDWPGGHEAMMRLGPAHGPVVVMAPALFEEANRTRAFTLCVLRALAARGIGSAFPDLPGMNESLFPLCRTTIDAWRTAFAAAVAAASDHGARPAVVASIRGGALLTGAAHAAGRWQCAPMTGATLVRELLRARKLADPDAAPPETMSADALLRIAGTEIPHALLDALRDAAPDSTPPLRIVRLDSDPAQADVHVPGPALWRRTEPGNDPVLAALLADDLAAWVRRCAG